MSRVKTMLPQLRFEGFSDEWVNKKVGDFGAVKMCKRIFKDQTSDKEKIPFYKIGTFGGIPDAYISEELYKEYLEKYPYPEVGDILISAAGTIGRTVIYNGEKAYYQDSNIVWLDHDKRSLSNAFFYQFLEVTNWNELEGSTIKRLYNSHLLGKEINIPSLDEQTKIGELFQKLDRAIELQQQKVEQSERYKKAMLQKMFPQKGEKVPRVRFAGFSGDWESKKLKQLGVIVTGSTPTTNETDNYDDGGLMWITPSDITSLITTKSAKRLSVKGQKKARIVPPNTLLITCIASIGKNTLVLEKSSFNQQINALIPYEQYNAYFLLTHSYFWSEIMKNYAAAGMMQIVNKNDFSNLSFLFPEKEEQTAIGNFFQKLDQQIEQQAQKLATYQQLKKAMLQRMFV